MIVDGEGGDVLRTTSGGYPHLTLTYTGAAVDAATLFADGADAVQPWIGREIALTGAVVNSFDKNGRMRYDVLLLPDTGATAAVEETRSGLARRLGAGTSVRPHVTHGIYWSAEEAEAARAAVAAKLPCKVRVTGFTVD